MVLVPHTSPSAQNRFLFHGDKLNRLPSSPMSLLQSLVRLPILRAALPGILREPWVPRRSCAPGETQLADESVHSFFARRFGEPLAENIASAMIHGIYAGDSRELSMQSVLPALVDAEQKHGSVLRAALPWEKYLNKYFRDEQRNRSREDRAKMAEVAGRLDPALVARVKDASIYSFPNGLSEIVGALEDHLIAMPHVQIRKAAACLQIEASDDRFTLQIQDENRALVADRVVSALPGAKLATLLPDIPHLAHNPSATMSVVDIILSAPDEAPMKYKLPISGFGFLVPRSATSNQDEILGVVLDSDAVPNQSPLDAQGHPRFLKLTVMMGGPYWRGKKREELPSVDEVEQRALRAVQTMLGIPDSVLRTHVSKVHGRVMVDTIPQYLVGHPARMQEVQETLLRDARWRGKLTLLGYSYAGVGVNDCVSTALDACDAIVQQELHGPTEASLRQGTGLTAILP